MSLPCTCLDFALPPLSPQILTTPVWAALAVHSFVSRGGADEVRSRFFSRHLPLKQGRAAHTVLSVLLWEAGEALSWQSAGTSTSFLKHLRSPRWWLQRPDLFTAQRSGYFVIRNESNFKACKGQKQPLAKGEEEADGNYTSSWEAAWTQTALVKLHMQRVKPQTSGVWWMRSNNSPLGQAETRNAGMMQFLSACFYSFRFGTNFFWGGTVSVHFHRCICQVRLCR